MSLKQREYNSKPNLSVRRKVTRRQVFLNLMEIFVPWDTLINALMPEQLLNKSDADEEKLLIAKETEFLLRLIFICDWYQVSHATIEDTVHESVAFSSFVDLKNAPEPFPAPEILTRFAQNVKNNELTTNIINSIADSLAKHSQILQRGSITEASLTRPANKQNSKMTETRQLI